MSELGGGRILKGNIREANGSVGMSGDQNHKETFIANKGKTGQK
jgi:hypothetical protein